MATGNSYGTHCPQCQHVLDQDNGHARCRSCGNFEMKALWSRLPSTVAGVKACGAVDYFCQPGMA
nr:zinc-ribbon domain-containing protein [Escherichia coli]